MKRIWKIICICILIFFVFHIMSTIISIHGWKFWKFAKCENPNEAIYINNVYVTDESVYMSGGTVSSALKYNGYTCKMIGESLYVGVRYGLFEGNGSDFNFEIKGEFSHLENVILTNASEERCVWNLKNDKKHMEKFKNVRLYATIHVSDDYDYKTNISEAEFVYADEKLLNRIQHPTFSDELYFTKGGGYLGVAELENGEELYLDFDRHFEYYDIIGVVGHYDY